MLSTRFVSMIQMMFGAEMEFSNLILGSMSGITENCVMMEIMMMGMDVPQTVRWKSHTGLASMRTMISLIALTSTVETRSLMESAFQRMCS